MISTPRVTTTGRIVWMTENGLLHRDGDKPAVIGPTGYLEYRVNGMLHRDGHKPAKYYLNGQFSYHTNGNQYFPRRLRS